MFNPLSTVHYQAKCVFYGMEDGDHNHFEIGYCAYHFERWGLERSDLIKFITDFGNDFTFKFQKILPLNGICYPEIPSILLKTFKTLKSLSVVIPQPMLISFFNIIFHHSHSQERMTPDMDSTDHLLTNGTNGTHKHHKKEKVSDTLFLEFLAFPLCKYCLQA